jgi:predicted transcriptional regulator of viral defense system
MEKKKNAYNYISDYLFEVRSKGRFAITLEDLRLKFDVSNKALLQNIYRLKAKDKITQIRKGFYVIIPPQYSHRGMLPPSLFIDDLMKFLRRDYYVGLFPAAALHGAGHQQPMKYQVITKKPALRNIVNQNLSISFFTKGSWGSEQITETKTEAGYINVSTPELTAFDLVYYSHKIGGINRIAPILEELTEVLKPSDLAKTAGNQKTPTIQRLGYLLSEMGTESLANLLFKVIEKGPLQEIPLSLAHANREGSLNQQWKIIVNAQLDIP